MDIPQTLLTSHTLSLQFSGTGGYESFIAFRVSWQRTIYLFFPNKRMFALLDYRQNYPEVDITDTTTRPPDIRYDIHKHASISFKINDREVAVNIPPTDPYVPTPAIEIPFPRIGTNEVTFRFVGVSDYTKRGRDFTWPSTGTPDVNIAASSATLRFTLYTHYKPFSI